MQHHYFRAGPVERGRFYHLWCEGYSRLTSVGMEYPWLTKREAQSAARAAGARAVFHLDRQAAQAALDWEKRDEDE